MGFINWILVEWLPIPCLVGAGQVVNSLHFYNVSHILHPVPFAFLGIPFPMVLTTMVITLTFDPRVIWYYLKLGQLNIWPSRNLLMRECQRILRQSTLQQGWSLTAQRFAAKWVPSNLLLNSELFRSYKHHTTLREK